MRRLIALLAAVAAGLLSLAAGAPSADAARRPCIPGTKAPLCHFRDARVVSVGDGDTIKVRIAGSRKLASVRLTGIDTMEMTRYSRNPARRRGACHSLEATAFTARAIRRSRWRVR